MAEESSRQLTSAEDLIKQDYGLIKCLSYQNADILFSAYMATVNFAPSEPTWWVSTYHLLENTAQLFGCLMPPIQVFEEAFSGSNLKCQCAQVAGQLVLEFTNEAGDRVTEAKSELGEAKQINSTSTSDGQLNCQWDDVDGLLHIQVVSAAGRSRPLWYIVPNEGTQCCAGSPNIPPTQPAPPPYVFGDVDAECGKRVTLIDSCIDRFGLVQNFYKWEADYRECGGEYYGTRYYWESVRGPYVYFENYLRNSWPGIGGDPEYAPTHPDFDPCPCSSKTNPDDKPVLEGNFRTISFRSDDVSPYGKNRLRKRFRYRSKGGNDLGAVVTHWKDFVFEAGAVIVQHKGAWWGTPQVWAISADEGKRVLRHAGTEAGIDPDTEGTYVISSPSGSRFGVSGTMRVDKQGGFYWITARDGSHQRPIVAKT